MRRWHQKRGSGRLMILIGDDHRPNHPWGRTVVYEAHVKGFTKQFPDLEHAGTYQALTDPRVIDYLKLGRYRRRAAAGTPAFGRIPPAKMGSSNYWGYNTYSPFAVEPSYAADAERAEELKQAVKALHQEGLEVILDVVVQPYRRAG